MERESEREMIERAYSVEPSGNRAHLPSMHQRTKLSLFDVSGLRCFPFDIQARADVCVCLCLSVCAKKRKHEKSEISYYFNVLGMSTKVVFIYYHQRKITHKVNRPIVLCHSYCICCIAPESSHLKWSRIQASRIDDS